MKRADKVGASRLVLVGEAEAARGVLALKDLRSGEQREIGAEELARELGASGDETEGSAR
jgi:histidyl-tRNA synthetase